MNNVTLIGNLTSEPKCEYTPSGTAVAKFRLAVAKIRREDGADFINITVFGKQAESCEKYLHKGSKAGIIGRIQTGSYKNREGNTVYTTDVVASSVEFLSKSAGDDCVSREPVDEIHFNDLDDAVQYFSAADDGFPF